MIGIRANGADPAPALELPLLGLFRHLLERGARLSVRDYLDALRALQAGHGGGGDRGALYRLACALWARTPEEQRIVARWFEVIPLPSSALIEPLERLLDPHRANAADAPATGDMQAQAHAPSTSAGAAPGTRTGPDGVHDAAARARVAFGAGDGAGGLGLPRLQADPLMREDHVLQPHLPMTLRELAVLWRRHRRAQRSGPKVELDLQATVRERCRQGHLAAPVCRARRRNTARLLVLADASPSMTPWQPFLQTLQSSLAHGRLGDGTMRWFANVPRRQVHRSARLDTPESCADWLDRHAGAGLLVLSDAGSARGALNRRRTAQTSEFLARAAAVCGSVVWINPMPPARWEGTTAALIAQDPRLQMLPLEPAQMLRAVDILRGIK